MKILTLYEDYDHHIQSIRGENHVYLLLIRIKDYKLNKNILMKLLQISFPKVHYQFDIISLLYHFLSFFPWETLNI
jgi:hypothetical protein